MREVKFRAWDKHMSKMVYKFMLGSVCNPEDDLWTCPLVLCSDNGWVNCETLTFMQYTGLKDKNGVEIYEGDVVKFFRDGIERHGGEIAPVRYSERRACFMFKLDGFSVPMHTNIPTSICSTDPETNIEVIGNIYENSELLTKQK